jgi:Rrf2 family protein
LRLPTKARYGMRAILELALHYDTGEPVLMRDIAARRGLPEKYLEQVLIPLRNAGLVRSVRGARGGYLLTRDPSEMTLLAIVEACIGDVTMVDCTDDPGYCSRVDSCATFVVWKELTEAIRATLAGRTLADLMDIERGLLPEKAITS